MLFVAEMEAAWGRGQILFAEDLISIHPEIRQSSEAVLRLVREEIRLRRNAGESISITELLERFPAWSLQIQKLYDSLDHDNSGLASFDMGASIGSEQVVARLVNEMTQRWRAGERPSAEEFLDRHPELRNEPESAVQLIYEEVCLRQDQGENVSPEEISGRFPQWSAQLQVLLDCHRLLGVSKGPEMPASHESLGDFFLLSELGRGAQGRVFLARHNVLANRQMVLKITPCTGQEHLSLARLQHTHIVPLYAVEDWPTRRLRGLVFPYLGRVTWKDLLEGLQLVPVQARQGKQILEILDEAESPGSREPSQQKAAHRLLAHESYVQSVCRMGACLAETLQYAHERGLVHLDVKPSNVLIASDGQPLLLDFHLAQAPVEPNGPLPEALGGTPGYMAPEQERTLAALKIGDAISERVDGQADIYSLGVLLYEALSGVRLPGTDAIRPLSRCNPQVSVGLSDIVHKCLAGNPRNRYGDGAMVAEDLRRHLENRPLRFVANRSVGERWRKWRRRRPYVLPVAALAFALVRAMATGGSLWVKQRGDRYQAADNYLREGQALLIQKRFADALVPLNRGQKLLAEQAPTSELAKSLATHARFAERAKSAQDLHYFVEMQRNFYLSESLPRRLALVMEAGGRNMWDRRTALLDSSQAPLEKQVEDTLKTDLLDLAICLADFRIRTRQGAEADHMRREALKNLDEAEVLFGQSAALMLERQRHAKALGLTEVAGDAEQKVAALTPLTPWDHFAMGRGLMRAGKYDEARKHLEQLGKKRPHPLAGGMHHFWMPQSYWTNFCLGICAAKTEKHLDAIDFFSACVGQDPSRPECLVQRGESHAVLDHYDRAYQDFSRALQFRPDDAEALLHRGILDCKHQKNRNGLADLERARDLGADPSTVYYYLAAVRTAQQDEAGALEDVKTALRHRPDFPAAQQLHDRLLKKS